MNSYKCAKKRALEAYPALKKYRRERMIRIFGKWLLWSLPVLALAVYMCIRYTNIAIPLIGAGLLFVVFWRIVAPLHNFKRFHGKITKLTAIAEENRTHTPCGENFSRLSPNLVLQDAYLASTRFDKIHQKIQRRRVHAVLREQIFCRCKEKMRSNIRYCEHFVCRRCRYLPSKTV